ncbi:MAG: ABC transporter ATP-binding protein [Candidatus Cyclobacteriaceae bacterium M2_1C_046]
MTEILTVENVKRVYSSGQHKLTVLEDINFSVTEGESIAIVGPSGSGKSTLLGLCAGLDLPSEGTISLNGIKLNAMGEDDRAYIRNQHVGFVFQNFQLLPTLTALENILVPMELRGNFESKEKAEDLLQKVGLGERMHHYPAQLSGGEQQRVALARGFINDPKIMFADEPTGNLDEENAHQVSNLLFEMNEQIGTTLVLVTHNLELASQTNRIIRLKGGKIHSDQTVMA